MTDKKEQVSEEVPANENVKEQETVVDKAGAGKEIKEEVKAEPEAEEGIRFGQVIGFKCWYISNG